ncbi:hypothetical protein FLW53_09345 [Microbispora sp. SCL1-1]|uniref:ERF family protein n=1 Tax=unclassified Microbispora TaxID=2614687 RepID=UPI001159ED4C|nr:MULTISPECIES: ERF family protein [unclassified Microbispora]NJP24403.1 hypothetical protein [Microbispora sp. CL1-1]TQS14557.1 hypothetical protein FLW53_09345 [Microbispora sp. SCL1-1]
MTDTPMNAVQALAKVKRAVGAVAKKDRNTQQGFAFRGVESVVNAVGPHLDRIGVVVMPVLESSTYDTVEVGKNRTLMGHVRVEVTYRFYGPDGTSYVDARVPGEAMDSGDKAASKAMAVAWRTALIQVLNLRTLDLEPDAQSYERSALATPEDYRDRALNLNATKDDLRRLYAEVSRAGHIQTAVVDEHGDQISLGHLIHRRGQEAPDGLPRNKDGSISRSKATPEQLEAVGTMTPQQMREHNKLVKDVTESAPADRTKDADLFDQWAKQPEPPAANGKRGGRQ